MTVRRLAFELDVTSASLYYHFRNKEEILTLAATMALENIRGVGDPARPWREWLLENTVRYRRALLVYPDLVPVLMRRHPLRIAATEDERAMTLLERQGVPTPVIIPLFGALESLACGSVLYASATAEFDRAEAWREDHPDLHRITLARGLSDDEAFERRPGPDRRDRGAGMSRAQWRRDRWESVSEIQQLAARYAIALDGRDPVAWAALYTPDVRVGPPIDGRGREDLERWFRAKCAYWYRSMHLIGAHQVDLSDPDDPDADPDAATGLVQCRVEQEMGERWVTTAFLYRDEYRRVDGRWLFAHRHGMPLWSYDQNTDPLDGFNRLPGGMPIRLPADYPAFRSFWSDFTDEQLNAVIRSPL